MALYRVKGSMDFDVQVEAANKARAKELIVKNLEAFVGAPHIVRTNCNTDTEYMEVIDSNFDEDDLDIELDP